MHTSLRSKIQEDHLTCPICFLKFTKPKALPCLHTFCVACLNDYVVGRNFESEGKFPCPVCRIDVQLPSQGVTGFPDNHIVASLIDTVEEAKKAPVIPPRPSQSRLDEAKLQHPQIPKLPNRLSPVPAQDQLPNRLSPNPGQHPKLFGSGAHREYLSKLVTDGIGTAKDAIHSISGYLYPHNSAGHVVNKELSPFEIVDKPSFPTNGQMEAVSNNPSGDGHTQNIQQIYPELVQETPGPCFEGCISTCGQFGAGVNDFIKPYGLTAGKQGEIIVTDKAGKRVLVFSKTGELSRFNIDCELSGIATTPDNNLMIAVSKSKSAIMRLYAMNDKRKTSVKFRRKGRGDNHFNQPKFVTSTSKNYIIVADSGNDCIQIFDITGNFKRSFGRTGDSHGCLNYPLGVATDAEDNIVIADSNNFRVEIYTAKGTFYTTFLQKTNLIGPDVKPINVCVTCDNNIAVLLYGTGFAQVRVYKWRQVQGGRVLV